MSHQSNESLHREVGLARLKCLLSFAYLKATIHAAMKSKNAKTRALGIAAFDEAFGLDKLGSDKKTQTMGDENGAAND